MSRQLVMAHDFGTSGVKACIFDTEGNFLAGIYETYQTEYPRAGYVVQNPDDWWKAMKTASAKVIKISGIQKEDIKAISFSSHGGALVPVDKNGNILTNRVMIWSDSRCRKEAREIIEKIGDRRHYEMTGNSMDLSMSIAAKLLWIRRNEPELYKKTYKFLGAKEYVIYKMTGVMGYTDYAEQCASGFYNIQTRSFDQTLLDTCGVEREKLCEGVDPTFVTGGLTSQAAEELGLCTGTPVVLGAWDNYACATGGGVRKDGVLVLCMGTAGWMGINHNEPVMVKENKTNVVHVGKDTFFTSIHSHSACASYDWVRSRMCTYLEDQDDPLKEAEKLAGKVPAGADRLFFLPSMFTGNTFYSGSALCGTFAGLKMMQGNGHLIRAAMEGPAFDLMIGAKLLKEKGLMPEKCHLIGGGAKSDLWCQILADMFGVKMMRPKNPQNIGALGAAFIACVGAGIIKDFDAVSEKIQTDDITMPDKKQTEVYEKLLPVYRHFYEQLLPVYEELEQLQL